MFQVGPLHLAERAIAAHILMLHDRLCGFIKRQLSLPGSYERQELLADIGASVSVYVGSFLISRIQLPSA